MTDIPITLQFIALLVAIAGGIALPFVLFILADMRARLNSLERLFHLTSSQSSVNAAQLAMISDQLAKVEKRHGN